MGDGREGGSPSIRSDNPPTPGHPSIALSRVEEVGRHPSPAWQVTRRSCSQRSGCAGSDVRWAYSLQPPVCVGWSRRPPPLMAATPPHLPSPHRLGGSAVAPWPCHALSPHPPSPSRTTLQARRAGVPLGYPDTRAPERCYWTVALHVCGLACDVPPCGKHAQRCRDGAGGCRCAASRGIKGRGRGRRRLSLVSRGRPVGEPFTLAGLS